MSSRAKAAMTIVGRFCDTSSIDGTCGSGRPRGTGPTNATPCAPRSNTTEAIRPPTTRTSAPGIFGNVKRSPRMTASATSADQQRRRAELAQAADPRRELLPRVHAVSRGSRELGQLADDDVDRGAGKEAGHDRPRKEAGEPAELEEGDQQEEGAGRERDRRHELRRLGAAQAGHQDGAAGDSRKR